MEMFVGKTGRPGQVGRNVIEVLMAALDRLRYRLVFGSSQEF